MKKFYLILCIAGIILPYWQFLSWIAENGLAIGALIQEAIGTRISAFAWLDYETALGLLTYDSNRTALWELNQRLLGLGPRAVPPHP